MTAWLAPALRDRLARRLDDLSRALVEPAQAGAAGGARARAAHAGAELDDTDVDGAGSALVHAYLEQRFAERGHAARCADFVDLAAARAQREPWLFDGGAAGYSWLLQHIGAADDDLAEVIAATDRNLVRHVREAGPLLPELVHGTAGLLVYALDRSAPCDELAAAVFAHLATTAVASTAGVSWPTHARFGAGTTDLGMAHGVAGIVAALAMVEISSCASDAGRALLRDGARWLLAQRLPGGGFGQSTAQATPVRTAWCYGDLGIAWAIVRAGTALGDAGLAGEGVAIAEDAAERRDPDGDGDEACLCHGAAGNAHVFARLAEATGSDRLAGAAVHWFERLLALPDPPGSGLMVGAGGVALVLSSALDPTALGWDAPQLCMAGEHRA